MVKKLVIAAAAVVVGLVIVKNTTVGSLLRVWWQDTGTFCSRQVSPETRIKQLRLEITKIDDDIRSAINKSIKIEVDHDKLKADIAGLQARQDQRAKEMKSLTASLKEVSNSPQKDEDTLRSLTAQYKSGKAELANRQERLVELAAQVELADEQITMLKNKKDELLARASKQESELARLQNKELATGVTVSCTQANRAEELADQIDESLQERVKRAEKYAKYGLTRTAPARVKQNKDDVIKASEEVLPADQKVVAGKE
jgi:chromosome segregation ATPase